MQTISTNKVAGIVLLSFGALGTLFSIFYESTVLVFISLTLIFWGCLFLLILPGKYVKSEVVCYMTSSSLSAINQMIENLNLQGKPIYIPVPKEVYLPYYVGAKNEFVYVPEGENKVETNLEQALMRSPRGIRITPPGLALVNFLEKNSKVDFQRVDLDSLTKMLPSLLTQELGIAEDFKIKVDGNNVMSEIRKSVCLELCEETQKMQHICSSIGCPQCSLIACILTRVIKKPIIIEECSIRNNKIQTLFHII